MFSIAGLAGLAIIVLIAWFGGRGRDAQRSGASGVHVGDPGRHKLTRFVKRFLDLVRVIVVAGAILLPLWTVANALNLFADPAVRNIDVFLGFKIDLDAVTSEVAESDRGMLIRGRTLMDIDAPSLTAWILSNAISELLLLILLYGLVQLRAVFSALTGGAPFAEENPGRIRKIGLALVGWYAISPLLQYFGGRAVLSDIAVDAPGIQFYPAFEFGLAGIFVGLAIIVLSGVLREAAIMHKEQLLTI